MSDERDETGKGESKEIERRESRRQQTWSLQLKRDKRAGVGVHVYMGLSLDRAMQGMKGKSSKGHFGEGEGYRCYEQLGRQRDRPIRKSFS